MDATLALPPIPVIDTGTAGPLALTEAAPERFDLIVANAVAHYGEAALRHGDRLSRRWLERSGNPYLGEIDRVAARLGRPGAYLLNLSYEWTCTAGVGADPDGAGMRLIRTLDWPLDGLGRAVVAARRAGPAGRYIDVTWPGYSGVVTALAPGRFAAAVNQPPMRRFSPVPALDWMIERTRLWRERALPPAHLLRRVFDSCASYAEAKWALVETRVCLPVFYTLAGTGAGEGCVIERTESAAWVREAPASIANHWVAAPFVGRPRGVDSEGRLRQMEACRDDARGDDFSWVRPPILNATTRIAAAVNAASGRLLAQGFESDGPATAVLRL